MHPFGSVHERPVVLGWEVGQYSDDLHAGSLAGRYVWLHGHDVRVVSQNFDYNSGSLKIVPFIVKDGSRRTELYKFPRKGMSGQTASPLATAFYSEISPQSEMSRSSCLAAYGRGEPVVIGRWMTTRSPSSSLVRRICWVMGFGRRDHNPKHYATVQPFADAKRVGRQGQRAQFTLVPGKLFANLNNARTNFDLPVLYPWKLERRSGERMVSVRNPYYWKLIRKARKQLPASDRLVGDLAKVTKLS